MSTKPLDGLRVLIAGRDAAISGVLAQVGALGALTEAATRIDDALDLLEESIHPYSAVLVADALDDADGMALVRAIRGSPLLIGEVRVAALTDGPLSDTADIVLAGADAAALVQAIAAPLPPRNDPARAPVLDLDALRAIAGGLNGDVWSMLTRFAGQARQLAEAASSAAAAQDGVAAASRAHDLRGAALSAGALRLGLLAERFERAATGGDWPTTAAIELVQEAEDLAAAISTELASRG
jgi:HPt (histidine-containing phosphotransfer) domain-containing protein